MLEETGTSERILLVGDDPRTATTLVEMLRAAWPAGLLVTQAPHIPDAVRELADHADTCVLLELADADDALATLSQLSAAAPDAPIVVVSDGGDEELGLRAVKAGAQDHLLKAELHPALLSRAVRYAVERKRSEVRLTRQALTDPLTGLPNRVLFGDRLSVALDRSRRTSLAPAVMFLDVDSFKEINDSLGHAAGDRLLRELAVRFGALLRPMDTVARFGGDEFTFLFEGLSGREEAAAIARRIGAAAAEPVTLDPAAPPTSVAVSVGIAMLEDPMVSLEDALHDADRAMYRAKGLGGGRAELHRPKGETDDIGDRPRPTPAPAVRLVRSDERELRDAIGSGQLRVHYQPRVSINGQTGLVGFEALVRWEHPERGLIAPAEFVPLAEETGQIGEIGDFVIDQALAQVRRWRKTRPGMTISVNVSRHQLEDPEMPTRLARTLARTLAEPSTLWLEVAEDAVATTTGGSPIASLAELRSLGVGIALDDFGLGRSSLHSLRDLPVDMLKIHQSFVAALGDSELGNGAVVGAVVDLGHALGLSVIAEGVETDHQLAELRDLGCDGAQGFLFSAPVPEASVCELLGTR